MSARLTRTFEIDDITPEELASIFAHMFDDQQARFLATVADIAKDWPGGGWCQQACSIAGHLDERGRFTIQKLAEHAGLIPDERGAS
jgi:hypothetical protein